MDVVIPLVFGLKAKIIQSDMVANFCEDVSSKIVTKQAIHGN
jgi:hypothetical protein